MRPFFSILALLAFVMTLHPAHAATSDEAERLYRAYGDAVYQVKVIDITSEKKNALGSGFQITRGGLLATNYHVVAEALHNPARDRLVYVSNKGVTGTLTIEDVDVIHDLALVKMQKPGKRWLRLGTSRLPKGTALYSIGNPNDLGFTIVPGTFNGLSYDSFTKNIHFSGSINPGMSGGPARGRDGRVAGINVETAGNGICYLVPVEHLTELLAHDRKMPPDYDFVAHADTHLQQQLLASQNHNIGELLSNKRWESVPFGPVRVPGQINEALKCWGDRNTSTDPLDAYFSICMTQDRLFLYEGFYSGSVLYRYDYFIPKKNLSLLRFYNFYQNQFGTPETDYRNAKQGDVTNFSCNSSFIWHAGFRGKANFCIRQYKLYPKIFDMHLYMAMIGAGRKGFVVTLMAQGVSKENALALARRFIEEIKPRKESADPPPNKRRTGGEK